MIEDIVSFTKQHRDTAYALLRRYFALEQKVLTQSELRREHAKLAEGRPDAAELSAPVLLDFVRHVHEGAFHGPWAYFSLRAAVGDWHFYRIHLETLSAEEIGVTDYLKFVELLIDPRLDVDNALEIDFSPFNRGLPKLKEPRSIGQGVLFLNRQLAGRMFNGPAEGERALLHFLSVHAIDGQQLLLDHGFQDAQSLRNALRRGLAEVTRLPDKTPWTDFADRLRGLGFAPGWGDCARRVAETMSLLSDILEAPSPESLEAFLARVPMISRLLILSPHGYFGQDKVLGLPDTGGQVVYILDQVRALEWEMRKRLAVQGVVVEPKILIVTRLIPEARGTTCNQRLEKVTGTENSWILRVPFHRENGEVVQHWISRFEIWPYLERFSTDVEHAALAELGGRPDLIIGNYSDGNLVASLLATRLGVTQCNIAHALEKTKYANSDLNWRTLESQYHFSCQYTADLIAMNAADFIITSTYQEIAGTSDTIGQYGAYRSFTMPGLYRVIHGIDQFDPKFNIVSPGANSGVYFSFNDTERRLKSLLPEIKELISGKPVAGQSKGRLAQPDKPLLFTMARLDRIKNLTGLVKWYGESQRLRDAANLLVIGGYIDPSASGDHEEREQIEMMHELIDRYQLDGQLRWIGTRLDKNLAGELYRYVADCKGAFVQPAVFEAFGLTIIEAMASGLPTFATCFGGPLEIIQHGRSGFHIDPNNGAAAADLMAEFFDRCKSDPNHWEEISQSALERVESRYTWKQYAERMMTLSRIYGFWKFVSGLEREETSRYLQMFYQLQFRPLAAAVAAD
jgi:sucrose synthase